ncbi:amidohydrolase [Aestuariivirga litoralis]|nr:amidohydrolase [Aestuariivirga litoralis]
MRNHGFLAILAVMLLPGPGLAAEPADVIFLNGNFTTLEQAQPAAEAVAVAGGRFLAVGTEADIAAYKGPATEVIDLGGRRVVPGLIDAHTHPLETLWMKSDWVDARYPEIPSVAVALQNLSARVASSKPGDWIYVACVSASENKFAEKRIPTRAELDAAAPDNPVILANGAHMAVANSKALAALGVKKGTLRLPHGGAVLVDAEGNPTGVITDGFADIPGSPAPGEIAGYYAEGIPALWNQNGFTSMLAITPLKAVPVLQQVSAAGKPANIRYSVSVWAAPDGAGLPDDLSILDMPKQADPDAFKFLGIKAWVDGENDCRTGFMSEPYQGHFDTDPAGGHGTLVTPQETADAFVDRAHASHRLAMLHCAGDAAMDICLTAYERSIKADPSPILRRIEHFGVFQMNDTQLMRAQALKKDQLAISVQPIWLTELVKADVENMGADLAKTGFRFRTMIEAGLEPAASTDMTGLYLGNVDPFKAMQAVVTRESDAGVFEPQEAVSVEDAVRMWTIWPARSIGEGASRGTISPGKLADMTVLSADIFAIPPDQIADVKAVQTIVGGLVVYRRP